MEFPDEVYRDVCCIKTLYSSKEGFFNEFVKIMFEEIDSEWIENDFKKQTSEIDKIRLCCNDTKVWTTVQNVLQNICKIYRQKCSEASKQSRLEGDLAFKLGDYKKAVMLYSQSVIRAPHSGQARAQAHVLDDFALPLAYKGRANALFNLHRYKECLNDLNMALREGFPKALTYQVYRQMGECYKNLLELNKAQISLQVALKLIDDQILHLETTVVKHGTKLDKSKDEALKNLLDKEREEIKEIMNEIPQLEGETKPEYEDLTPKYIGGPLPEITGTANERYPRASNLVKVKQTGVFGRFAVAADKIETGSTLVVEQPQASLLIPEMLGSHCLHCFTRLFAPVPCNTCSGVAFCSTACRDTATSSYHKYECEFLGLFLGSGMSVLSQLALRMITQESLFFFKNLYSKLNTLRHKKETSSAVNFSLAESQYMHVYNLTTHSHLRTGEDYFRRALMAIFLVKCLRETDFFDPKPKEYDPKKFSEDEMLTASLILHHLELLQFNAHEIYETRVVKQHQTRDSKATYIAVGIYPTVALFNHECVSSVVRYFNGKNIVIKSVRPLQKNEILSENYGPHYAKKSLYERIRELTSRYWFHCQCKACVEDWPLIGNLTSEHFKLRCTTPNCNVLFSQPKSTRSSETNPICQVCLKKINLVEVLKKKSKIQVLFDQAINYMENQNCTKAIPLLTAYLDEIYQMGTPPCREIFLGVEALRTCYAQSGNVWVLND